jgi:hypothetical protein
MNPACFKRTFSFIHLTARTQQNLQQEWYEETTCNIILVQKRNGFYYTVDNADVATHYLLLDFVFSNTILRYKTCLYEARFI